MSMQLVDGGAHVFSRSKLDADGNVVDATLLAAIADGIAQLGYRVSSGPSR